MGKPEAQPPNVSTVNKLLEESEAGADPLYRALRLIAYSGIRRGECLGLQWQHVDFANQKVTIVSSVARSVEMGLILEPPKSKASRRVVDLDDATVAELRQHRIRQIRHHLTLVETYWDNNLVFPDLLGRALNPMKLKRAKQRC